MKTHFKDHQPDDGMPLPSLADLPQKGHEVCFVRETVLKALRQSTAASSPTADSDEVSPR